MRIIAGFPTIHDFFNSDRSVAIGAGLSLSPSRINYSPLKILDMYHIRWPVETGIKDLIQNYFLIS